MHLFPTLARTVSRCSAIAFLSLIPLHAAVTFPEAVSYRWNFTLIDLGLQSSTIDMLVIQFNHTDKLTAPERMIIQMYSGAATEPMYYKDWYGTSFGLNGLIVTETNWDASLSDLAGRLELTMFGGSVSLQTLSIRLETGTRRYAASISPNVTVVPEPTTPILLTVAMTLICRRRRHR